MYGSCDGVEGALSLISVRPCAIVSEHGPRSAGSGLDLKQFGLVVVSQVHLFQQLGCQVDKDGPIDIVLWKGKSSIAKQSSAAQAHLEMHPRRQR